MKNHTSLIDRLTNRHFFLAWLAFHAGILVFFISVFAAAKGNLKIDADLFNMLPKPFSQESIAAADEKLTEATGQAVFILSKNEDFDEAKSAAEKVYAKLKDSDKFKTISLYSDMESLSGVTDFIYRHRWNLLNEDAIDQINSEGGAEIFAENALAKAFGAFTLFPLDNLETDPFMLSETALSNYLNSMQDSGVAMSVKDGVIASQMDGFWYVMIRGVLTKEGAAVASESNGIAEIYSVCDPLEKEGATFIYSGTPFHSYKSSTSASREIKFISTVSLIVVITILLLVFRSPVPIFLALFSILIAVASSFVTTLAVFQKMHVLTLVFGTSLIGSCIDYSLHYFINWKGNDDLKTSSIIRKYLFSGLTLSLVSTEICYLILVFAPFNLLKQMAVFSLVGIFSSFLTVMGIYPFIPIPKKRGLSKRLTNVVIMPSWYNKKLVGRFVISGLFVVSIASVIIGFKRVSIQNQVNNLYDMKGRALSDTIEAARVLQYAPSSWYIICGDTEEDVLTKEENLYRKCAARAEEIGIKGYTHVSSYIPSVEMQKKSREACRKLLEIAEDQLSYLGFDESYADSLRKEFASSENDFITFKNGIPKFMLDAVSTVWLGEINGKFYSVMLPSTTNHPEILEEFAADDDEIFYVNKIKTMNNDFDSLTKMILRMFCVAYVVIFVVLRIFYKTKQALKIISIPLLIILVISMIFVFAGIHLEFFSITGMILVFGLGLDYVIYMVESEKRSEKSENAVLEPFAILLSFVTTAVSFGALALSSFKPVHYMGLSIFIGLITAYFCSSFYDRSEVQAAEK